ncbi:MAG TPA: PepSY-associated TM helix domain-containing protein [Pyrinomonadaceae bacterium]|nr:PepSY-associated TM helix domain-containing protein [Pyrinomonadaceae bacterium]
MKQLRKFIFWCHLVAGTVAGLIILTMSVTGVLLTYERQITSWADSRRNARVNPPSPDQARLSPESLLAKMRESQTATPSGLTLKAGRDAPAEVAFGRERTLFLNPYTGEVLGEGSKGARDFFHAVTDWHRWLGRQGEGRLVGRAVTGACNLIFFFIVLSGFYLWWPRKWTRAALRNVTWFRRGTSGKARDFNWHNVIGFWSALPLLIIVFSGVVISYPWASNLVYKAFGETPPPQRGGPPRQLPSGGAPAQPSKVGDIKELLAGTDPLWQRAEQQMPGWQSITMQVPESIEAPVTFSIDQGNGGQPQKRAQLTLHRTNGEVVRWEPFSSYTAGRKARTLLRFAHTGEVAGIIGQSIAGLASAGSAVLVWTGLALAWRRFRSWKASRAGLSAPR